MGAIVVTHLSRLWDGFVWGSLNCEPKLVKPIKFNKSNCNSGRLFTAHFEPT